MKTNYQSIAATCLCAWSLMASAALAAAPPIPPYVSAAVEDNTRPGTDKVRDSNRLPGETIAFAGVKPGDLVGELLPGGGYYTRILSKVVGAQGHVYAFAQKQPANAPADLPDINVRIRALAQEPGIGNVTVVEQPLTNTTFPVPLDLIWTSQNYHDFHNLPGLDVAVLNKQIFDALKPGGIYLVLDHAALKGADISVTKTLHRIDADTVKKEVLAAGFKFDGSSDLLANKTDPHSAAVFDASIRGKTDQFILKFRKPKTKGK
jgi:predicted methyltransferase